MIKVIAYGVRPDEELAFHEYTESHPGVELTLVHELISEDNIDQIDGHAISTLLAELDRPLLEKLAQRGVKFISTRSIGYNNIDVKAANELGIHVSNTSYSPGSVAEYALMHLLMGMRKVALTEREVARNNFAIAGQDGKEVGSSTIGIIGTGRIGLRLAQLLSGFGCTVLGYDPYENPDAKGLIEYVSLDELFARSDAISLHAPANPSDFHLVGRETIAKMKDGVVLVNCARGDLVDSQALIEALRSGKVGAAGLDVVEGDEPIFHYDWSTKQLPLEDLEVLKQLPNVIVTPHTAFYTMDVVREMVTCSMGSLRHFATSGKAGHEVKPKE